MPQKDIIPKPTKFARVKTFLKEHKDDYWSQSEIAKEVKLKPSLVRTYIARLHNSGQLEKSKGSLYRWRGDLPNLNPFDPEAMLGLHRLKLINRAPKLEVWDTVGVKIMNRNPLAYADNKEHKVIDHIGYADQKIGFNVTIKLSSSIEIEISCRDDIDLPDLLPSELILIFFFIKDIYGLDLRKDAKNWEVTSFDLNRDFYRAHLEGMNSLSLQDLMGKVLFKFYNKPHSFRIEAANNYPINLDSLVNFLYGQIPPGFDRITYLITENKNEMRRLSAMINSLEKNLTRLYGRK